MWLESLTKRNTLANWVSSFGMGYNTGCPNDIRQCIAERFDVTFQTTSLIVVMVGLERVGVKQMTWRGWMKVAIMSVITDEVIDDLRNRTNQDTKYIVRPIGLLYQTSHIKGDIQVGWPQKRENWAKAIEVKHTQTHTQAHYTRPCHHPSSSITILGWADQNNKDPFL